MAETNTILQSNYLPIKNKSKKKKRKRKVYSSVGEPASAPRATQQALFAAWQDLGMSYFAINSLNTYISLVRVQSIQTALPCQGRDFSQISLALSLHLPCEHTETRLRLLCPHDNVSPFSVSHWSSFFFFFFKVIGL